MYKNLFRFSKLLTATVLLVLCSAQNAKACHGVLLVGLTTTSTGSGLTVDASSDASTCGCGPYWMEVEVACCATCFTGTMPNASTGTWNVYPYYHSLLNVPNYNAASGWPDNCAQEPYTTITIPWTDLCPGTTYYLRAHEYVQGDNSIGQWSGAISFTTPGSPPVTTLQATANQYTGCPGDQLQLNATVTGGCPGSFFTYSWLPTTGLSNPNIANPTLTIQPNSTTYTVTVTGGCVSITSADDTVAIINGPPPFSGSISSNPTSVCSGGSSQLTLNGASPNSTYQWQVSPNGTSWFNISGATNSTYNTGPMNSSLYYQVIVTGSGWPNGSGCGTSTSAPIQVIVNPSPVADAGLGTNICTGGCTTLTGSGGTTYSWQPNNANTQSTTVCPTSTTQYTLTVTDANGCTDNDVVTVSVSNETVATSPNVSICNGNNTILIASAPNGSSFSWLPNNGTLSSTSVANPTASPTVTTTYTVTASNAFGCTAVDSITVTVTAAPAITASADTSLCAGGSATLSVTGANSYSWSPGNMSGQSVTVSPTTTTTYVVTGNNNNCLSYDTVVVTVAPPLPVFAGPDFSICNGSQATLNVATTGTSYSWQPSSGIIGNNNTQTVTIDPASTTAYTVTVTDPNGCISQDVINVTVNPAPTVTATATTTSICVGGSTTLTGSGAASYVWLPTIGVQNPNQASTTAIPPNTTTYTVVGTNANGCTDSASITITVNPLPSYYLISNPSECGDTTGFFSNGGPTTGTGPFTFQIGSQTYTSFPIGSFPPGNYNVIITDANGCSSTVNIPIGVVNNSFVNASANPNSGAYPLPVGFNAAGSSGLNNFIWSFGDSLNTTSNQQNPNFTYLAPGVYTVTLIAYNDNAGCAVYDTLTIDVFQQALIALPNVFTPNGDNTNDQFFASVTGVKEMSVEIYDRWGNLLHEETVSNIAANKQDVPLWDGKNKGGNVASDGVYYYVVRATGYDDKPYPFTGFVHLMQTKQ